MKCRKQTQKIKNKIKQSVKSYPKLLTGKVATDHKKIPSGEQICEKPSNPYSFKPKNAQKHADEPLKAHPLGNSYEKKRKETLTENFQITNETPKTKKKCRR